MRYFDKFKTIFSKDKTIEYNRMNNVNTAVSVFDANYSQIPEYAELSEEARLKVDNLQSQINYADYQMEGYYGKILQLYSRDNIDLLYRILNKIAELKSNTTLQNNAGQSNINSRNNTELKKIEDLLNNYINLVILRVEAQLTLNGLLDLVEEAKLKNIALERFIKRESRHSYDFIGAFGKDERAKYLNNKEHIKLIKDQLLASTIDIARQVQEIAFKMSDANLQDYIDSQKIEISKLEDSKQISLIVIGLMEKRIYQIRDEYKLLFENEDLSELDNLIKKLKDLRSNYNESHNFETLENSQIDLGENFLINLVPYQRKIDIEVYKHREDYYDVVGELSDLFMKLSNIDSKEELENYINNYYNTERRVVMLLTLCRNYLKKDTIAKLEENYKNITQILFILNTPIEYRYANISGIENVGLFSKVFDLNTSNKNLANNQDNEAVEKVLEIVNRRFTNLISSRCKYEEVEADKRFLDIVDYIYRVYFSLYCEQPNEMKANEFDSKVITNSKDYFDEIKFEFLKYITALLNGKGPLYANFFSIADAEKLIKLDNQNGDIYKGFILNKNIEYTFSYIKKLYDFFSINKLEKITLPKIEGKKLTFGENEKNLILQNMKASIWNLLLDKKLQEKPIEDVIIIPNAVVGYNGNIDSNSIEEINLEENRMFPDIFYEDKKGLFIHNNFSLYALSKIFEMKDKTKYNQNNVMLPNLKYLFVERGEGNLNSNREIYELVISTIRKSGIKVLETDEKHLEEAIFKMEKVSERIIRSEEILQTA